jgi:hypothetical protein
MASQAGEEVALSGGKGEYGVDIAAGWGRIGTDGKGGWCAGTAKGCCGFWFWFLRDCWGVRLRGFCCVCEVAVMQGEGGQDKSAVDGTAKDILDAVSCRKNQ